ncbi:MAG: hypothetical protein O2912_06375 [Proteobacteria bacterium]|nr:hypothetical protein [Pseudomonadota bacterium]
MLPGKFSRKYWHARVTAAGRKQVTGPCGANARTSERADENVSIAWEASAIVSPDSVSLSGIGERDLMIKLGNVKRQIYIHEKLFLVRHKGLKNKDLMDIFG